MREHRERVSGRPAHKKRVEAILWLAPRRRAAAPVRAPASVVHRSSSGYVSVVGLARERQRGGRLALEPAEQRVEHRVQCRSRCSAARGGHWLVGKSAVAVLASVASVALTIGLWQLAERALTRTAPSAAVPRLHADEGSSLIEVVSSDDRAVLELRPLDEVHRQARTHRGVWVFVVNAVGQAVAPHA